jgi:shikimate 5-dehydrogenase
MMPADTPLLIAARQRGCTVVPGRAMLDAQLPEVMRFLRLGEPATTP